MRRALAFRLVLLLGAVLLPAATLASANIVIVNGNAPGVGFNDPTPATPVGGNPGTTIGQQRLNAFQFAADAWGAVLDSPVPIYIQSTFQPLACTATSATLGAAGALQVFGNFPGTEIQNTWYHVALANKLAGADLSPGPNGTSADDIVALFNSNLGNPGCLTGSGWYYGYDTNHGSKIDLVTVLLHEFGHGLGFSAFFNKSTGALLAGYPDVYSHYTFDVTTGKSYPQMSAAERASSTVNTRQVVWDGINVTHAAPSVLYPGSPLLRVNSPSGLGPYSVGTAAFGPALASPGVSGDLVVALDAANAAGPTTSDACTTITNAAAVAGKVALVDRGTCGFTVKVKNAQDAGAVAVVVADNLAGGPAAGLGGADPTITIPSARVTLADGNALKAALGAGVVNVTLGVDLAVRAGVHPTSGFVMLYTPVPLVSGSSISHFDTLAFRNLLMEPNINADLTHSVVPPEDLTLQEMKDVGWFSDGDGVPDGEDACLGSLTTATVVVGGCDSGVANTVFGNGCTISDQVNACARGAGNHGVFVSCVSGVSNTLKKQGAITGAQKGAIEACAARAAIP